jgi:hypothetical protein
MRAAPSRSWARRANVCGPVRRHGCGGRRDPRSTDADELVQAFQEGLFATAEGDRVEVALEVQHTLGECLLVGERPEHPMLDGAFGDQMDDGHGPRLVLAPGARDALFEACRVPGQIAIDDDAGVLQIQAGAAGVGGEEQAAFRIGLDRLISARRRLGPMKGPKMPRFQAEDRYA